MAAKTVPQIIDSIVSPVVAKIEAEFAAHAAADVSQTSGMAALADRVAALEARFVGVDDEPVAMPGDTAPDPAPAS